MSPVGNEGATVLQTSVLVQQLRAWWNDFDEKQRGIINRIGFDAARARVYIGMNETCTERRYWIAKGIFDLVRSGQYDTYLVREVVERITGTWYPTAGEAVGHLDAQTAQEFAWVCQLVAKDMANLIWDDTAQTHRVDIQDFPQTQGATHE
jgi:hypothetical protein